MIRDCTYRIVSTLISSLLFFFRIEIDHISVKKNAFVFGHQLCRTRKAMLFNLCLLVQKF